MKNNTDKHTPLPWSNVRVHPHIDVGNSDGPQPLSEISRELQGGDWYDLGYFHNAADAAYATHAANVLPELLAALETLKEATMSPLGYGLEEAIAIADAAIAKAGGAR